MIESWIFGATLPINVIRLLYGNYAVLDRRWRGGISPVWNVQGLPESKVAYNNYVDFCRIES
jgi:hypothetical protein